VGWSECEDGRHSSTALLLPAAVRRAGGELPRLASVREEGVDSSDDDESSYNTEGDVDGEEEEEEEEEEGEEGLSDEDIDEDELADLGLEEDETLSHYRPSSRGTDRMGPSASSTGNFHHYYPALPTNHPPCNHPTMDRNAPPPEGWVHSDEEEDVPEVDPDCVCVLAPTSGEKDFQKAALAAHNVKTERQMLEKAEEEEGEEEEEEDEDEEVEEEEGEEEEEEEEEEGEEGEDEDEGGEEDEDEEEEGDEEEQQTRDEEEEEEIVNAKSRQKKPVKKRGRPVKNPPKSKRGRPSISSPGSLEVELLRNVRASKGNAPTRAAAAAAAASALLMETKGVRRPKSSSFHAPVGRKAIDGIVHNGLGDNVGGRALKGVKLKTRVGGSSAFSSPSAAATQRTGKSRGSEEKGGKKAQKSVESGGWGVRLALKRLQSSKGAKAFQARPTFVGKALSPGVRELVNLL